MRIAMIVGWGLLASSAAFGEVDCNDLVGGWHSDAYFPEVAATQRSDEYFDADGSYRAVVMSTFDGQQRHYDLIGRWSCDNGVVTVHWGARHTCFTGTSYLEIRELSASYFAYGLISAEAPHGTIAAEIVALRPVDPSPP